MSTNADNGVPASPQGLVKDYHVKFYELCYQQYINEFERTNQFHQKIGLWLTAMLAIGAASYVLAHSVLIEQIRTDTFVFMQCFAAVAVWLPLAFGAYSVFRTLRVRDTKMIATMDKWQKWLEAVDNRDNPPDESRIQEINDTLTLNLIRDFAKCQSECFQENTKRAEWFKKLQDSVFCSAFFLAIQAFFGILTVIVK
jgi:hypothetical protein